MQVYYALKWRRVMVNLVPRWLNIFF